MKHLLACTIAVICLASCGKSDKSTDTPPSAPTTKTTPPSQTKATFEIPLSKETVSFVKAISPEVVQVMVFLPTASAGAAALSDYFTRLAEQSGTTIKVVVHDFKKQAALARKLRVRKHGVVVILRDKVKRQLVIGTEITSPRFRSKWFDKQLRGILLDARSRGTIYVVDGVDTRTVATQKQLGIATFRRIAEAVGYKLRALTRNQTTVPSDAAMVALIGPEKPIPAALHAALHTYLAKGGRLLLAMYGGRKTSADAFLDYMDLAYRPHLILDPSHHAKLKRPNPALILTSGLAKHPVWRYLTGKNRQMVFPMTGSLGRSTRRPTIKREFKHERIAHSEPSSFADKNGNGTFDAGEKRGQYTVGIAVTGPNGLRALVFGSSLLFTDGVASQLRHVQLLFDGAIRWLDERKK